MADDFGVLSELRKIEWKHIAKTFGNCHSTLIGAIVQWWNSYGNHYVLEPGCSPGYFPGNRGGRICDAVLCKGPDARDIRPVGILEVEAPGGILSGDPPSIFTRLATYISPNERQHSRYFSELEFLLLVGYEYAASGRKGNKHVTVTLASDAIVQHAQRFLNDNCPFTGQLFVVLVHKEHEDKFFRRNAKDPLEGRNVIRNKNEFYPCSMFGVEAFEVLRTGGIAGSCSLFSDEDFHGRPK